MNQSTIAFIRDHAEDDVRRLALKGSAGGVDMHYALQQIAGRQMARRKLPSWAATEGLEYPPHLSMEQCSGERAAIYKASVAQRLLPRGGRLVDLTGGFGVDFSFLARQFDEAVYVERQAHLCGIARTNMPLLGLPNATIVCGDSAEYLAMMPPAAMIFVDPARRDGGGGRTFAISDCVPDVAELRDALLQKADIVMIKLSPMLDWRKAVGDLGDRVGEVHIVAVDNECKDLLLVMSQRYRGLECIYCVNDDETTIVTDANAAAPPARNAVVSDHVAGAFLYEPNAAIMKAGCFAALEERFPVCQIEQNSHLFVGERLVADFPGRRFLIEKRLTMNKKELKAGVAGVAKANIATRNFPLSAAELRKRLKLSDGGDTYIFATTERDATHVLLVCRKA